MPGHQHLLRLDADVHQIYDHQNSGVGRLYVGLGAWLKIIVLTPAQTLAF